MATKKQEEVKTLDKKDMCRPVQYRVTIEGDATGMLQNRMPELCMSKAEKKDQVKRDYIDIEREEWRNKMYIGDNGNVVVPGENIHECLIAGANYWGEKAQGNKSFRVIFKAGLLVDTMDLGIKPDDIRVQPFGRMVNGTPSKGKGSGAKVYKIRPHIRPWSGSFVVTVFDGRITFDVLHTVLSHAGSYVGLSDWRPKYGRFIIVSIDEVSHV